MNKMDISKYANSPEASTALKVASMNPSTAAAIKMAKLSIPVANKFADMAMPLANKFSASANKFASGLKSSISVPVIPTSEAPATPTAAATPVPPTTSATPTTPVPPSTEPATSTPTTPTSESPATPTDKKEDKPDPPEVSFIQQIRNKITNGEFPSIDFLPPFPAAEVLKIVSSLNNIVQNNLPKVNEYIKLSVDNETAKLKHKLEIENALAEETKNANLENHVDKYISHVLAPS